MSNRKSISRREFVRRFSAASGCFVVSAQITGCQSSPIRSGVSPRYTFPQGIASADPQPDAVLLWTRIVDSGSAGPTPVRVELASDEEFSNVVASEALIASSETDYTLRCFVDGLAPNRWYWYRFITPDGYASQTGRTRSAPDPQDDVELRAAVLSCQSYEAGYFNAYRRLILDDLAAAPQDQIDLCLHMGDFIYENVNANGIFTPPGQRNWLNEDGSPRNVSPLPSGGAARGRTGQKLPVTLDDYRHVYKVYLSDPLLQAARARYPFVCIWDDHEVLNDYWQAYHPGGSVQTRKVAGNQAWFEFVPAVLTEAQDGPGGANPARDFTFADVNDAPQGEFDADYLSREPNTVAAVQSLTIYRTLRWGQRVELILTDGRSYRGPRGLDNSILGTGLIAYPNAPIDPNLIRIMNAGETANNGNPPEFLEYEGETIANPRRDSPRGGFLGATQKQWLKDTLTASDARWQLLCTNVPFMRFGFDTRFRPHGTASSVFWTDSWDGYPVERQELMDFITQEQLTNVVSITGDRHAHFAGFVCADYEQPNPTPVIPELIGASISQQDRFSIQYRQFRDDPELHSRTGFSGARIGYLNEDAPALNTWFLFGHESAKRLTETADIEAALSVADDTVNPHMIYSDADAYGYYKLRVANDSIATEFVVIPAPTRDESKETPAVRRRVRMRIPAWQPGDEPSLTDLEVDGEEPLGGIRS